VSSYLSNDPRVQTQGRDERLHRTFQEDVLDHQELNDLIDSQVHFDLWRDIYNYERPHAALRMAVPADRYTPSPRPFPEQLPPILHDPGVIVRMVNQAGKISFIIGSSASEKPFATIQWHSCLPNRMGTLSCFSASRRLLKSVCGWIIVKELCCYPCLRRTVTYLPDESVTHVSSLYSWDKE
jgi:hypothetical protein